MKIVNIVTRDDGGGGRAAYRLNRALNLTGCDATLYVSSKFHADPATVVFKPRNDLLSKLKRLKYRVSRRLAERAWPVREPGWTPDDQCQRGSDPVAQIPPADLINLHTISNFFDYAAYFPSVPMRVPTVWTIHTMAPFTGGCDYACECRAFEERCGRCPFLHSRQDRDPSRKVWLSKARIFAAVPPSRMHLAAPSNWIAGEIARSSLLKRFSTHVIPNGIDTLAYAPRDKRAAREVLQIPPEARVLLFVTQHAIGTKLKGFAALMEAIRGMDAVGNLHLVTLGAGDLGALPVPHIHLGHVFNDNLLSLAYNAADVFVIPSLMDNLPNVVLEAMACGTPVVGFATGGIPEMVRPGETGELAPAGEVRALREAIESLLLNTRRREELSLRCREIAVREYALEVQGARYLSLYESILDSIRRENPAILAP